MQYVFNHPQLGEITIHYITEPGEAEESIRLLMGQHHVGFDTETYPLPEWQDQDIKAGTDPHKSLIRLLQFALPNKHAYVFDLLKIGHVLDDKFRNLLESDVIKVGHNLTFDAKFCRMRLGVRWFGKLFDTDVAFRVLGMGRIPYNVKLAKLVSDLLGFDLEKEEQKSNWSVPELAESQIIYSGLDAYVCLPLREILLQQIIDYRMVSAAKVDFDVIDPVATMELNGLFMDRERWAIVDTEVRKNRLDVIDEIALMLQDVIQQPGLFPGAPIGAVKLTKKEPKKPKLSITSAKFVQAIMEDMGLEVPKLKKRDGKIISSTRSFLLEPLRKTEPFIDKLLLFRELNKRKTSYGADYPNKYIHPVTGRIHAKYDPLRAVTSRFGNSKPNLQQIPHLQTYRDCFRPQVLETHNFVIADYSQIELRIAAQFSQDYGYITAFNSGEDFHAATARLMFGDAMAKEMRSIAKRINFGILYGMGPQKLSLQSGMTYDESMVHLRNYYDTFEDLMKYLKISGQTCARTGKSRTWKGHIGKFYVDRKDRTSVSQAERNGMNLPIQGTSADILKIAMRQLHNQIGDRNDIKMVHIVHDEIILEAEKQVSEEAKEMLEQTMIKAGEEFLKSVPVKVDGKIADRWLKD